MEDIVRWDFGRSVECLCVPSDGLLYFFFFLFPLDILACKALDDSASIVFLSLRPCDSHLVYIKYVCANDVTSMRCVFAISSCTQYKLFQACKLNIKHAANKTILLSIRDSDANS